MIKEIPYKKTLLVVISAIAVLLLVGLMNDLLAFQKIVKQHSKVAIKL
ncbi:hypothetical protein HMPREF9964_0211 [Streptococcus dysgalactiae subsp. equisimilis SK1249]|nr:hypothetical protein HMPREF9964_0211 [Streptococcus dysgalactiae subsp. equisimilis SK1249]